MLQERAVDRDLQVAEAQVKQLIIAQAFPGMFAGAGRGIWHRGKL
jgi:hypothetical protein